MLNVLTKDLKYLNPSIHCLQRRLPGYLILFAPYAFVPQRQFLTQIVAFAIDVPSHIFEFHLSMWNSTIPF